MKRSRRFLSFGLALLSLAVCVTAIIFWGRSYRHEEGFCYNARGALHLMVSSEPGYVWFQTAHDLGTTIPQPQGFWAYSGSPFDELERPPGTDITWLGFGAANGDRAIFWPSFSNSGVRVFQDGLYLRTGIALPYWFLALLAFILPARIARHFLRLFFSRRALVSLALCMMVMVAWAISYYHVEPIWHYARGRTCQLLVASDSGRIWLTGIYNKPIPGLPSVDWKPSMGIYHFVIQDNPMGVVMDGQGNVSENNSSFGLLGVWVIEDTFTVRRWRFFVARDWMLPDPSVVLAVPYWFLTLLTLIWPTASIVHTTRTRRRNNMNLCSGCGYDLRTTPHRCPECGLVIDGKC